MSREESHALWQAMPEIRLAMMKRPVEWFPKEGSSSDVVASMGRIVPSVCLGFASAADLARLLQAQNASRSSDSS